MKSPAHSLHLFKRLAAGAAPICFVLFASAEILAGGPSVAALLATCDRGFAQGNKGPDAAACEWYGVPCECSSRYTNADTPRWCIPATETPERTVRKVVAELRLYPDPAASVDSVVPAILAKLYPCKPGLGPVME
jgi:hypothetical protein